MAQIIHKGITYQIFDSLSNKDMTGWDLSKRTDLNNKVIYNSCLSNEKPDANVLPTNLSGAKFVACNLDNVKIPAGNQVIDCSVKRFKVQNDLEDWIVDGSLKPTEPVMKKRYLQLGLSVDPNDIPAEKLDQSIITKTIEETPVP